VGVAITARLLLLNDASGVPDDAFFTAAEQQRIGAFRSGSARHQFEVARTLARDLVADRLGVDPRQVSLAQRCPTCGSAAHGRPEPQPPQGLHVSWSHTSGAVLAAVSTRPVGVDVEATSAFDSTADGVMAMVCSPRERAALPADETQRTRTLAQLWTIKEALIKVGALELDTMSQLDLGLAHTGAADWQGCVGKWRIDSRRLQGFACSVVSPGAPADDTLEFRPMTEEARP
jgi:4'-phosphopantetheinyl transferase